MDSNKLAHHSFYKKPFASGKFRAYLAGEDFIEVDPDEGDDLSNENADDGDVACLAADIGEAEDVELVELDVVAAKDVLFPLVG